MNKLNVYFYDCKYGWWTFLINNNRKLLNKINASYVYNPFFDYVRTLEKLNKNYRGKLLIDIDQEGFSGILVFKIINQGKSILFTTYTDINEKSRIRRKLPKKTTTIFNKKQFINEMKMKLLKSYQKNHREVKLEIFDFDFNIKDLKNIKCIYKNKI